MLNKSDLGGQVFWGNTICNVASLQNFHLNCTNDVQTERAMKEIFLRLWASVLADVGCSYN